ncbi:MAG: MerR family transcriptional regulator [Bacteroidetes bacterium]|nr:MerR family transcriptional regulator [Bacteroidota bacterium]
MENLLQPGFDEEVEDTPKKYYFSMGEVCEMFDVAPSLVRYWHSEFSEIRPLKNKKGNRLFRPQDIETIKVIYHLLKERGFTIQGAKDYLKSQKKISKGDFELIESLKKIRSQLVDLKEFLK